MVQKIQHIIFVTIYLTITAHETVSATLFKCLQKRTCSAVQCKVTSCIIRLQ